MPAVVTVTPERLVYHSPLTAQQTDFITITNDSDERIAFKVKTTAPKLYCVKPNAAIIKPGETVRVSVILLGLDENDARVIVNNAATGSYKCKDKFLVITIPVSDEILVKYGINEDENIANIWSDLSSQVPEAQIGSRKIRVNYKPEEIHPEKDRAVTQTKTETETETEPHIEDTRKAGSVIIDATSKKELKESQLQNSRMSANSSLKSPLNKSTSESKTESHNSNSTIPTSTLMLVVAVAMALGWLYH